MRGGLNRQSPRFVSRVALEAIPGSEMDTMTATFARSIHQRNLAVIGLCVIEAGLLVTSGLIHLHLERTAYQHVKTIGPLFIVQFVSCLVMAAALLLTRHLLVALAAVGLMAGTIVG